MYILMDAKIHSFQFKILSFRVKIHENDAVWVSQLLKNAPHNQLVKVKWREREYEERS